ncbi:hypothetical protein E4634_02800 [Mangrovimicrobium sediminis]|uniref:Murein lipoprotein n=1 Tax=Mangrovimicrobium sediminis TaxID=2562682 RepID=A0A4Z0M807_9GAMM|nr:Lpp/OprI family alanine-zipper lipoprotein [Haliea sp. SAOS-164]TGD75813.1 hypothetical protein E4634_02800 [Haliea sp. SAOS-164]
MKTLARITTSTALLAALAATTGCATSSDIDALRAEMMAEINRANATADKAAADAASAKQDAASAKATADQALQSAQATDEKLDRMFKKSMYK